VLFRSERSSLEAFMYGYGLVGLLVTVILIVLLLRLLGVM